MTMTIYNFVIQQQTLVILSGASRRFFLLPQAGRDAESKDLSSADVRAPF